MTLKGIAHKRKMGAWTDASSCLVQKPRNKRKRVSMVMTAPSSFKAGKGRNRWLKPRALLLFGSVVVLLPILLVPLVSREENGSLTTYRVRGTDLTLYCSDSGNLLFAKTPQDMSGEPRWQITRRNKILWFACGLMLPYLDAPRGLLSVFDDD
jgi:hypothetical protein